MRTSEIKKMIRDAVADEEKTSRLANNMREVARRNGADPNPQDVEGGVACVREYIEHVPYYLEQATNAARQAGLGAEMAQMVSELEAYWFEANDLIPDHLGMMGLMDDAYACLMLLQSLSEYTQATLGRPLLQQNLSQINLAIRQLIGEPVATQLDQRVGITVANAMMQRVIGQVMNTGFSFGGGPDPYWGNASVDEIVNVRLGAMGVV